eukprot:3259205-Pyramimonas_sp.AAC.1
MSHPQDPQSERCDDNVTPGLTCLLSASSSSLVSAASADRSASASTSCQGVTLSSHFASVHPVGVTLSSCLRLLSGVPEGKLGGELNSSVRT